MLERTRPSKLVRAVPAALLVPLALGTTSCGGGGSAPPARPAAAKQEATLRFVWPARAVRGGGARRRQYVSLSIQSLTIAVDNQTPITETAPTPTGSPQTVTYTIGIAPGTHTLAIAEYDAASKLLGRASEPITIAIDQANTIGFTLDGNLGKIAIVPVADPFLEGTLASGFTLVGDRAQTFDAIPEDVDGNRIIAPGAIPAITTASAAPAAIVDTDSGNDTFTLYAPAPTAAQTITASGQDLNGNTVTATFAANALAAFYVANFTTQTIGVYDENGTQLPMPASAFTGVENPGGLAYIPSQTPGQAGTLAITQTADGSVPAVSKYDTAGNILSLAATAFSGTAEPLFLGYGMVGTTPTLAVPDEDSSQIQLFDLSGNPLPVAAGAFSKLDFPTQILYDAHDADYYVTNLGSATISRYSAAGAPITTGVSANNATMGETLDTNTNDIYVVYQQQPVPEMPIDGKPVSLGPEIAHVLEFDETLTPVTLSATAFLPPTTTAFYATILFDPYLKQLYVTDAGDNTIVAFTEAGAGVTLPTGAFANLSDPLGMAIVP